MQQIHHFENVVFFGGVFFENLPVNVSSFSSARCCLLCRAGDGGGIIGGLRRLIDEQTKTTQVFELQAVVPPGPAQCGPSEVLLGVPVPKGQQAASQARWLAKPQNRDYFRGPAHTDEMRCEAQADVAALVRERQKLMARKYAMGDSSSLFG